MPFVVQIDNKVITNRFEVGEADFYIGRDTDCQLQIDDRAVSHKHAVIRLNRADDKYYLIDLDSTNGSFVNEEKVKQQVLQHEDLIRIGWTELTFIDERNLSHEETQKIHKTWIPGVFYTK
jgi:pSer/pThr/pTyr-binding forkhead associated (FHA) protein